MVEEGLVVVQEVLMLVVEEEEVEGVKLMAEVVVVEVVVVEGGAGFFMSGQELRGGLPMCLCAAAWHYPALPVCPLVYRLAITLVMLN